MKLAVLNGSISRANGGVSEVARRLAQELGRQHLGPIEVLGLADEFVREDAVQWAPLQPRVFEPAIRSYGYTSKFAEQLAAFGPDLCHVHGLWLYPSLAARRWSQRSQRPYLISPHGMLDPWALAHSRWKKRVAAVLFERRNLAGASSLHATCLPELRALRAYGLRNPIAVVHNAVDLPSDAPASSPWRDEVTGGRRVLLYLGRLHPKKGLAALIDGWAHAWKHDAAAREWALVIAGWDQDGHEAELRARVKELGAEGSVHFAGPLFGEAKQAAYASAEAFVLPSHSEGLPLVVLEAWAARKPVLMTDACNLQQGFTAGAAWRIEPEAESIARGVSALAEQSDAERRAMGERGRQLVETQFTWPRAAAEMKSVYEWMLGGGTAPACVELR